MRINLHIRILSNTEEYSGTVSVLVLGASVSADCRRTRVTAGVAGVQWVTFNKAHHFALSCQKME